MAGLLAPLLEEVWASSTARRLAVTTFLKCLSGAIVAGFVVSVTGDGEEDDDEEVWVREIRFKEIETGAGAISVGWVGFQKFRER